MQVNIVKLICCTKCNDSYFYHIVCASPNTVTINKHLGSSLHFQCRTTSCNDVKYNYTHYNPVTGEPECVIETSASKCTQKILNFDYGGSYCCHSQCASDFTSRSATPECCIDVASRAYSYHVTVWLSTFVPVVLPVFQWILPKAVALNGSPVTGSCSASGYPRPNVRVIIPAGCDYQQNNVHVGNYTNKAVFTMNVTKHCEQIYCLASSKTYSVLRTEKLLIVGKCAVT